MQKLIFFAIFENANNVFFALILNCTFFPILELYPFFATKTIYTIAYLIQNIDHCECQNVQGLLKGWQVVKHVPSEAAELLGEAEVAAAPGDGALLLILVLLVLLAGRFPRPHIEKSKSSALYSKLCFSKYCLNSLRDRNFLPSGLYY